VAVSFTNLTRGGTGVPASSFNTASVTPTANQGVLVSFGGLLASGNGPGSALSVSGCGLTWTFVAGVDFGIAQGSAFNLRIETWYGVGASPTNGAITISYGTSPTSCTWAVDQMSGAATTFAAAIGITGTNFSNTQTAQPATVTMGTFNSSTSGTFGAGFNENNGGSVSNGTGMTELGFSGNLPKMETEFAAGNISPVQTNYSDALARWAIIGLEIKVPGDDIITISNQYRIAVG
jgi:hypothetical protein